MGLDAAAKYGVHIAQMIAASRPSVILLSDFTKKILRKNDLLVRDL